MRRFKVITFSLSSGDPMRRSGPTKVGGWEFFLQAGAKPEGKENASEEAGDVSDDFANGEGQFT